MENLTLSQVLKKHRFSFKKRLGQNFISNVGLLREIVNLSGATKSDTVIEIGAGGGTLTRVLAAVAKNVIAFEIDKSLKGVLLEMTAEHENIEFIMDDFLKFDIDELEKKAKNYIVVANLPYYITTPIIMRFVEKASGYKKLIFMVQEEVALRLQAKENTAEYGAITAQIGLLNDVKIIKKVSKGNFYPQPDVNSAVVEIVKNLSKNSVLSLEMYQKTVKCAFFSRRKTLVNNLIAFFKVERQQAETALKSCGIDLLARGESLPIKQLAALSDYLFKALN